MDYKKAWGKVKDNLEEAVSEGYENGYNDPKSEEYGKFYAYRYSLDLMTRLEREAEE